jgi:sucrose-6-phosphate hydrolase SacC (GH32 family)
MWRQKSDGTLVLKRSRKLKLNDVTWGHMHWGHVGSHDVTWGHVWSRKLETRDLGSVVIVVQANSLFGKQKCMTEVRDFFQ